MTRQEAIYESARVHGLSHNDALDAVAAGAVRCWCGKSEPCAGGAQRYIGCPTWIGNDGPFAFEHTRHRGDVA